MKRTHERGKMIMGVLTPDERFGNLSDYPFAPHYVAGKGLHIHYGSSRAATPS